ncbi:MAG: hypothetical protein GXO64_02170, partial [Candidatus Micrarchaeota archaeon]|nr:hypothetical protein [Candidatus Micrarchaeota archaeon]
IGDSYLVHGHAWPSKEFAEYKYLIIGHEHPQIEFRDALGYRFRERIWVKASLKTHLILAHYKKAKMQKLPKLIILPAFNRLCGGICLNENYERVKRADGTIGLGPVARSADMGNAEIYLLDGTNIGKLMDVERANGAKV